MSQIIKCPKCDERSWSKDYWTCPSCGYSESREWVLLEENKDYQEGRGNGDEPALDLGFWMKGQEELTKEMVNECLPRGKYNWKVDFPLSLGKDNWGGTTYCENDPQEVSNFRLRHSKELINHNYSQWVSLPNQQGIVLLPSNPPFGKIGYYAGSQPTGIYFPKWLLTYEGSYNFDGWGYFPTIPHEAGHASSEVQRHPKYQPFTSQHSSGYGHDDIHYNKNREFYNKLVGKKYIEKIKARFKEYRKITGKDENKYD